MLRVPLPESYQVLPASQEIRAITAPRVAHALRALALPALLLMAWSVGSASGWFSAYLLPPPAAVWSSALELAGDGRLTTHIGASGARVLGGFALAVALALPLGLLIALTPRLAAWLHLPLEFLRVVPPLALMPVLILWFGIGEAAKLAVVVLSSFFPIFLNTVGALRTVDSRLLELAHSLELTARERLWHVQLPAALPQTLTGLRLGFGYSWRALVGAELIAAPAGLGFLISESAEMARPDQVFVGIFTIALLGVLADWVFVRITRWCAPWATEDKA
ncbi:MAG: ABC transporter permease [Burkholderiaceae bacterium]